MPILSYFVELKREKKKESKKNENIKKTLPKKSVF